MPSGPFACSHVRVTPVQLMQLLPQGKYWLYDHKPQKECMPFTFLFFFTTLLIKSLRYQNKIGGLGGGVGVQRLWDIFSKSHKHKLTFHFHVLWSDFPVCSLLCYVRMAALSDHWTPFLDKKWNNTGISGDISSLDKKQVCCFKGFEWTTTGQ